MDKQHVGVIAGFGAKTDLSFLDNVLSRSEKIAGKPKVSVEFLPFRRNDENDLINGRLNANFRNTLIEGVKQLNKNGVEYIVMPCNTAHIFLKDLDQHSKAPIVSIMALTAKYLQEKGIKKLGIIGTSMTIKRRLHHQFLEKVGIEVVTPSKQKLVDEMIIDTINARNLETHKQRILTFINELKFKKCQAILLGCTDLFIPLGESDTGIEIVDTKAILENFVIQNSVDINL